MNKKPKITQNWHPALSFVGLLTKKAGLPVPVEEYRFHNTRLWRFDNAFPSEKLAIEVDGGSWINGRHNRASGYKKDCEKFNQAVVLGWRVLHYTYEMIDADPLRVATEIADAFNFKGGGNDEKNALDQALDGEQERQKVRHAH